VGYWFIIVYQEIKILIVNRTDPAGHAGAIPGMLAWQIIISFWKKQSYS
jgi:hypothetical protein